MAARAGKAAARLARRNRRPLLGQRQDGPGRARRLGPAGIIRALDSLPHGFCLFDAADRLLFVSDGFRRLFGPPARRVRPGLHAREVSAASTVGILHAGQDFTDLWGARRRLTRGEATTVLQMGPDGRQIAITLHPQVGGDWAALYEDVTERRRAEALLRYMAHHDPLTGLPNRYLFGARLDRALAAPGGRTCALLCIDLDGFKPANDRFGHAAGDALLRQLAERLREGLGGEDIAARLGGDEFSVLLGDVAPAPALAFAFRLHARLAEPYDLGADSPVRVGAAIGLACAPLHATRAQLLAERADAAMYGAKRLGHPCLWDEELLGSAPARAATPA